VIQRLRGAFTVAARVSARVERASVENWLPERLLAPVPGTLTVIFHSIVEEYLPAPVR